MTPKVATPWSKKSFGNDFIVASRISNNPYPNVMAGVIRWRDVNGPSHMVAGDKGGV